MEPKLATDLIPATALNPGLVWSYGLGFMQYFNLSAVLIFTGLVCQNIGPTQLVVHIRIPEHQGLGV